MSMVSMAGTGRAGTGSAVVGENGSRGVQRVPTNGNWRLDPSRKKSEPGPKRPEDTRSGGGGGGAAAPVSGAAYTPAAVSGGGGQAGAPADTFYDDMRSSYRENYDRQVAENNAAADKAAERSRQSAAEQRAALDAEYQGTNRQLYRDYKQQERLLPQQMAARGYSGGLTESSRLRLRNSYEEGLNQNERSRIGQEAKINAALSQQEYEAQAAADRANAQARQGLYAALTGLQTQKHQEDRSDAAQRAAVLAAAGDYSGYRAMGWSEGEIAYLSRMWGAKNPLLQGSQSYGHYSDEGRVKNTAAWQVASYLRRTYGADTAVDYVAEELAAGNLMSDEAADLRKYLRNEG